MMFLDNLEEAIAIVVTEIMTDPKQWSVMDDPFGDLHERTIGG